MVVGDSDIPLLSEITGTIPGGSLHGKKFDVSTVAGMSKERMTVFMQ